MRFTAIITATMACVGLATLTSASSPSSKIPPVPTKRVHPSVTPLPSVLRSIFPPDLLIPADLTSTGLPSEDYVSSLRSVFGSNTIPPPKTKSLLERIGDEFKDTLVRILLCVAVVSAGFSYLEVRWRIRLPAAMALSPLASATPH